MRMRAVFAAEVRYGVVALSVLDSVMPDSVLRSCIKNWNHRLKPGGKPAGKAV